MTSGPTRHSGGGNGRERRGRASGTSTVGPTPFVGRDQELAKLRAAFEHATSGSGSLIFIAGEPGIGKTRLCHELEVYAQARGAQVLWGGSHEASGAPPYWPWLEAIRQWGRTNKFAVVGALSDTHAGKLACLFPELAEAAGGHAPPPIIDPASAQFRLFDAFVALLEAMTAESPIVVVLEDLHWSDRPTVQLLEHVARAIPQLRMLIVSTYRDTDVSRGDPLSGALAGLNRNPGYVRLVLRGLSTEAVRAYVRETAGAEPSGPIVALLHEQTEGNPFLLVELVQLLTEEGTITTAEASSVRVPQGVKEALGRRLDRLSERARELMLVAAVVGREFTYDELASLRGAGTVPRHRDAGRSPGGEVDADDALVALIDEGIGNSIIEEMEPPGRYRFTHALMQETLLGELSTTRRALLHGRVGEALEDRWGDHADQRASRLAGHFLESWALTPGHLGRARRYAALAGEQAERQFAWAEAARWYRAATEGVEDPDPRLLRALANTWATAFGSWTPDGVPLFLAAIDAYRRAGDLRGLAETVAELPLGFVLLPFAGPLLNEAIAAETGVEARTEVALRLKLCRRYLLLGESEVSLAEIERPESELLDLANHQDESTGEALRATVAAYRANRRTEFRESARHFAEAAALYERLGRPFDVCEGLNWASSRSLTCGDLALARLYAEANAQLAAKYGHFSGNIAAMYLWVLGAMQSKEPVSTDLQSLPVAAGPIAGSWWKLVRGLRPEAVAMLGAAGLSSTSQRRLNSSAHRTAVLFGARGREAASADFSSWAVAWRTRVGDPAERSSSFALVARALPELGDDSLCREVWEEARHWKNWVSFWTGIGVDAGRGTLALRLGLVDEARAAFAEGVTWAEREGCPIEIGRNLAGLARVAACEGNFALARSLLDRAAALFRQLDANLYLDDILAHRAELSARESRVRSSDGQFHLAARGMTGTPAKWDADAGNPLSRREAEVLRLLATGLRNREIADRLVISERTVERHVSNIYRKLDVRGKADATAWALRAGLI